MIKKWLQHAMDHIIIMVKFLFAGEYPWDMPPVYSSRDDVYTPPPKNHKSYDTTRFTQGHYDFIMVCYAELLHHNNLAKVGGYERKTQQDLADVLNEKMGLDKSVNAYARIWRGYVDRDDLPQGKETFRL